jgi:hypothetical protein
LNKRRAEKRERDRVISKLNTAGIQSKMCFDKKFLHLNLKAADVKKKT